MRLIKSVSGPRSATETEIETAAATVAESVIMTVAATESAIVTVAATESAIVTVAATESAIVTVTVAEIVTVIAAEIATVTSTETAPAIATEIEVTPPIEDSSEVLDLSLENCRRVPLGSVTFVSFFSLSNSEKHSKYSYASSGNIDISSVKFVDNRCRDFLKGNCFRGSSCRFVHDDSPAGSAAPSYPRSQRDKDGGACFDFQDGKCFRGSSCKFLHVLTSQSNSSSSSSHPQKRRVEEEPAEPPRSVKRPTKTFCCIAQTSSHVIARYVLASALEITKQV
jgi:hypothetical protein